MKQKILTIIFGMIILIGIVSAAGTITNLSPSLDIPPFVAGGTTSTTFSFDYEDDGFNNPDASLVLKVNISSMDLEYPSNEGDIINGYWDEATQECRSSPDQPTGIPYVPVPGQVGVTLSQCCFNYALQQVDCNNPEILWEGFNKYPVWKGDFQLSGFIEQYSLFGLFLQKIFPLKCVEDIAEFRVEQGLLYTKTNIPNGTFYCYDPNNYLDMLELDKRDKATLFISSHPALYPGEYNVSVDLLEMEPDNSPPEIKLILDNFIFNENQTIPIKLNVTDLYKIRIVEYKITNPDLSSYYNSGWIEVQLNESSGLYEHTFDYSDYNLTEDGAYWIFARACDVLRNCREM